MNKVIGICIAMFGLSIGVLPATAFAKGPSSCTTVSSSRVLEKGDADFATTMRDLNAYFSSQIGSDSKVKLPRNATGLIKPEAETILVEVNYTSCAGKNGPGLAPNAIGGCDYVGCTGSLGAEFSSMPAGSVVSISACGGGVKTSGTFVKGSNGSWVMTKYSEEKVHSCTLD
jgi:hypothetical protein